MQFLTTNSTFKILHSSCLSQCECACKTMKRFSTTNHITFKTKKTFPSHAQEAIDMLAMDYSADLCLVSA